jgi:hypothetical protein
MSQRRGLWVVMALLMWRLPANAQYFSSQQAASTVMHPSGVSLALPQTRNINLSRQEIERVRNGRTEWYREYARITNAALPYDHCSLQAGTSSWDSPSYAELQMRGYSFEAAPAVVETTIRAKALSAARSLPKKTASNASVSESEVGRWHRILVSYDAWYVDYGGPAAVAFYVTGQGSRTVVLVFMNAESGGGSATIQPILDSLTW